MPRPVSIQDDVILHAAREIFLEKGWDATTSEIVLVATVACAFGARHVCDSARDVETDEIEPEREPREPDYRDIPALSRKRGPYGPRAVGVSEYGLSRAAAVGVEVGALGYRF